MDKKNFALKEIWIIMIEKFRGPMRPSQSRKSLSAACSTRYTCRLCESRGHAEWFANDVLYDVA